MKYVFYIFIAAAMWFGPEIKKQIDIYQNYKIKYEKILEEREKLNEIILDLDAKVKTFKTSYEIVKQENENLKKKIKKLEDKLRDRFGI